MIGGWAAALTCADTSASPTNAITPERFGAKGDGVTNDTKAFEDLSRFINTQGGGVIHLRPVTYVVGQQSRNRNADDYGFSPAPIMKFEACSRALTVRGNGARLRSAAGLRYGTFDGLTGRATHHPMPHLSPPSEIAAPYRAMIWIERCSGPIEISDLELDGNMSGLMIGGQYGDVGWQLPATGIQLVDNRGSERLLRIRSHHHALDGILVDGIDGRTSRSQFEDVQCDHNGRQGCSLVGGRGYDFLRCRFNHTGKAEISSPPGAGVDVEAEGGKRIRDLHFYGCEFSDNTGAGLVADNGNSEGAMFENCRFIGTTDWAAWPNKPRFRFDRCIFVGPIVHAFGDPDPARAAQFHECLFKDDPALSPTAEVYGGENPSRPIADLPDNKNVLFDHCRFLLTHRAVLPWTTNAVTFVDCVMSQRSKKTAYPRGTFIGRNVISGPVELYSARIRGELIVNGKQMPRSE
jgi:hypothetical protein